MNQIHEDDWGEESWSRHSGMFEPSSWSDDETTFDESFVNDATRLIVEISRENGYSPELIAELTGLTIAQIESLT